jgi:maltose alpha-D-glucosyltransferase/alpha-amylase
VRSVHWLLDVFVLDKALYEVEYELASRPDWVVIPLLGILRILNAPDPPTIRRD